MIFATHGRRSYLALSVGVALGLSACSSSPSGAKAQPKTSSSSPADEGSASALFQQLRKTSTAAKSVRIKGTITNGATATSKAMTVQVDIAGDRAGKSLRAVVNDGTGEVEILTAGGTTYLKADSAYWTKNGTAAIAKAAAGKYIKVPAGSAAAMSDLTVGKLLDQIFAKDISAQGKLNTTVGKAVVNGVPAYVMTTKADSTKIFVSADGQAHLMRVVGPTGQLGSLDFTQWDAVAPVSSPAATQITTVPGL